MDYSPTPPSCFPNDATGMNIQTAVHNTTLPTPVRVGEGPHWEPSIARLHWVDILSGTVHSSDTATGHTTSIVVPTMVGAAIPRTTGGFVLATADGFATLNTDGTFQPRLNILGDGLRMNDAKCDRQGRLWAGSTAMAFTPGHGRLHVLLPDWSTHIVLEGLTLPNGLAWSPDGQTFYLIDTLEGELSAFDTDDSTTDIGSTTITRRRVLYRFAAELGMPDGLTVDSTGGLWIAMWGGGRLLHLSPEGDLLAEITMPVHQPSSCAFGGDHRDKLYVTSAREGLDLSGDSPDGSVFVIHDTGSTGLNSEAFRG